ncbi:ABC transporter substrate-binding protein [Vacuolonema iberomarrocanum]|uniref:ABC transporter substrate-binding protein n=1 Tax=Vacuolonema iberomarrocanum TaxID=3454632 RepID=UPI0019F89E33|nr:amino acid ABC transporter substrate-binding protein [filamentous cyanobacterium LEGE 07170]
MSALPNTVSRRFILSGFAGFGLAIALHACGQPERPNASAEASNNNDAVSPLKIGLNVGNVPWEYENDQGDLVGFEVDLVTLVAERLGRPTEFVDMPFTELFPAVLSGRVDLAMSSITITEERMETVDFAQPYYDSDQSLTVLAEGAISSLEDMRGKVVAVDSDSTGDVWVQENMEGYGFSEIIRYEGLTAAMMDLKAGQYDGYISDIPALLYYAKDHPEIAVVERIPTGEQYSMMFAKGNPLRDEINALITELKEAGQMAEIHTRWFGRAPDANTSTVQAADIPTLR